MSSFERQSPNAVPCVDSLHNLAHPSTNFMESSHARRSTDGQLTLKEILLKEPRAGIGSKSVVVIVDATRELSLNALQWALTNVVETGDDITLLGILHQVQNPMGYKQKADIRAFNGTSKKQLDEEISRKLEILRNACLDPEIHRVREQNGIKLEVKIAAGPSTKTVATKWAMDLQASWVILDRAMKKDKKHLMEHIDCNLALMKRNGGEVIRLNQPILDDEHVSGSILNELTSSGPFLDNRGPLTIKSKASEQNALYNSEVDHQHTRSPPFESEYHDRASPPLREHLIGSSSWNINQYKSETLTSDVDYKSEVVDPKDVYSYYKPLRGTSNSPSDSEPTGQMELGTSPGVIWDDNREVSALGTPTRSTSSLHDLSGPISNAVSSDSFDVLTEQSFKPIKTSSSRTDLDAGVQRQKLNFSDDDVSSGSHEISPPNAATTLTVSSKAWPPKSQAYVHSTDSNRLSQSESSVSPSTSRPRSSHGRGSTVTPHSTGSTEGLTVYKPKPLSARKNLELNDLLSKSGSFSDRTAARLRRVSTFWNAVSDSRQTTLQKTQPIDITVLRSRTQIEGVMNDESKSVTPPSIASPLIPSGREIDRLRKFNLQPEEEDSNSEFDPNSSMRIHMSLKRFTAGAPPLCSICNHKSPEFGRSPRKFTYAELEIATNNFCPDNFLAEGGFGFVYKGVLKEGQEVAVKQYKLASSQGDMEFCAEVEVLSCAQHRNLVTLIGYCVENHRRLLVYEFVCNGSLDWHLSSRNPNVLKWQARQKIAVGAARGLRYLHEECRIGCIVHRDMRPNNILLTHDFVPMVGDFGLARWQPNGDTAVETRVIGTLGYLAPEYAETGQITEKADVYSFGVVLLELITGRKAIDASRNRGEQCLTEWARPKLEERATHELLDPRLEDSYDDYELYCMVHAASLCIRKEPLMRPKMSQVLRILEGDKDTTGGSSSPLRGFCRSSSTEAFTPTGYSAINRMDSFDNTYGVHARASEMTGLPVGVKADREPILPHSAPLLAGASSRSSKSSADEKNLGEKNPHAVGSRSSHVPNASAKTGSSPRSRLSYFQMLS